MVSEKVLRFQGKDRNLSQLCQQILLYLQNDGYKVQSTAAVFGFVIQAQKTGIARRIIAADRCFTITVSGQPNDFAVHIGIGKWAQNLAVAAAEAIVLSVLFLAIDVPEMLWTRRIQDKIMKKIAELVESPTPSENAQKTIKEGEVIREREVIREVVMIKCTHCGTRNLQTSSKCSNCGAPL